MTLTELEAQIIAIDHRERQLELDMVRLIDRVDRERLYLDRAPNVYAWLTTRLGLAAPLARRRLDLTRMIQEVPEAMDALERGSLSPLAVTRARARFRRQERATGIKVEVDRRAEILRALENQSLDEVERILCEMLPESATYQPEFIRRADAKTHRAGLNLTNECLDDLNWLRDLFSHALPKGRLYGDLIAYLAALTRKRYASSKAKYHVIRLRGCEYVDPETGERCGSHVHAQVDHIIPRAHGGTDEPANLRCLCGPHNRLMAERELGRERARRRRRGGRAPP